MIKRIGLVVCASMMLLFAGCAKMSDEECTFLNERANLHSEYIVSVTDLGVLDTIFIYKNPEDTEKSELIGTRSKYLYVTVFIEHQSVASPKEEHFLDKDDFKIKDTTGFQLGNITILESFQASAKSKIEFDDVKAVADYSWVDTKIEAGTSREITLYFEFKKDFDIDNALMVLEVDFFYSGFGTKKGTDIVLINRAKD